MPRPRTRIAFLVSSAESMAYTTSLHWKVPVAFEPLVVHLPHGYLRVPASAGDQTCGDLPAREANDSATSSPLARYGDAARRGATCKNGSVERHTLTPKLSAYLSKYQFTPPFYTWPSDRNFIIHVS
ncbi:hypothetical protein MSAN_01990600 [Mycena sanguinolenta]|uniref:Uncharacterized protein n=1 Tax=Mycena sanguinolenta TaxID=230812 RepID=A0A8H6XLT2_9AGAR|nr:hypothetical protein MSAN_01990600 [Mycena sanguinolenta]